MPNDKSRVYIRARRREFLDTVNNGLGTRARACERASERATSEILGCPRTLYRATRRDATRRDDAAAATTEAAADDDVRGAHRSAAGLVCSTDNDNVLTVFADSGAMANIAAQRIKREFKEVIKSEEVSERASQRTSGVKSAALGRRPGIAWSSSR